MAKGVLLLNDMTQKEGGDHWEASEADRVGQTEQPGQTVLLEKLPGVGVLACQAKAGPQARVHGIGVHCPDQLNR